MSDKNHSLPETDIEPMQSSNKRLTIALPSDSVGMLDLLCDLQGTAQVEAIRRAISTESFIQNELRSGARIYVELPDGKIKELVFL